MNRDARLLAEICNNYGLTDENNLYKYMVESYLNGQLLQAKNILHELSQITTMQYNYIERFNENLDIWFDPSTAENIKNFFKINTTERENY